MTNLRTLYFYKSIIFINIVFCCSLFLHPRSACVELCAISCLSLPGRNIGLTTPFEHKSFPLSHWSNAVLRFSFTSVSTKTEKEPKHIHKETKGKNIAMARNIKVNLVCIIFVYSLANWKVSRWHLGHHLILLSRQANERNLPLCRREFQFYPSVHPYIKTHNSVMDSLEFAW